MKRIFADNPYVKEVRGRGLYAGVEFKEEFVAKGPELSMLMLANGELIFEEKKKFQIVNLLFANFTLV